MTNIQSIFNSVRDLAISGVNSLPVVPSQVSTAQLPCKYVRYAGSSYEVSSLSDTYGLPTHRFEIVFLLETVGQNTNIENQKLTVEIADLLYDSLDTIAYVLTVNISFEINIIAGQKFWSLIGEIEVIDNGS